MAGTIEISNLRNIKRLRFDIPDQGVWLLTGRNGAGKTSLLACIHRIGYSNAFAFHFPTSLKSDRLDNHSSGSITYEINEKTVEYAYRGERWTPRPRSNSHLFQSFGYPSVTYIGATADRITPRPEDFEPRLVRTPSRSIMDAANNIFETDKFSALRTVNLAPGVGNDIFVLAIPGNPQTYHSEKHFSLGELCVLKLLRLIKEISNHSLIIIDELEMALHPRAQVKLLRYLEEQSRQKSLTVLFSTHSVTLLKTIERRRIIYLERQDDHEIKAIFGCFPTYAIGNISSEEETVPDIVIYVEDLFARDILHAFFDQFVNEKFPNPSERPSAKVLPIGGFNEVVAFLDKNKSVLPDQCVQKAILDGDVSEETIEGWKAGNNHTQLAKFQKLNNSVMYLPFTPEVGAMSYFTGHVQQIEQALRKRFADNQIRIEGVLQAYDPTLIGKPLRQCAKTVTEKLINYLSQRTQHGSEIIRDELCREFASLAWQEHRPKFMRLFGALL